MNTEQLKKLSKMKKLIMEGKRRFANRKDRDYTKELLDIGINEYAAWNEILSLNSKNYVIDAKNKFSEKLNEALIFKKFINGYLVYIKLKIEKYNNGELTVCLSFHIDYK